jgi:hypothetical protein
MFEDDQELSLSPINFFQITGDCKYTSEHKLPELTKGAGKAYLLPSTHGLCHEKTFADIGMGWSEQGLTFRIDVHQPVTQILYPEITNGDSIELFIDTRDVKTSGFNTRFCHHFFFLPESMDERQAGELTHFRTEDSHSHCDPNSLTVNCKKSSSAYTMQIFIPADCLFGYDPDQFKRIGFSYRINRPDGPPQHFSVVSQEYTIEQQPSLWSSLRLVK